jgi:hypothetical protein
MSAETDSWRNIPISLIITLDAGNLERQALSENS